MEIISANLVFGGNNVKAEIMDGLGSNGRRHGFGGWTIGVAGDYGRVYTSLFYKGLA
jgi:hypothetical protein